MRFLKLVLFLVAVGSCATVSAVEQDVVLNDIHVWSNAGGNDVVRVTTPSQSVVNPSGCSDTDSYMVLSTLAKETTARIYSTLLTAKALGQAVTVRLSGCELNRPAITSVFL